MLLHFTRSRAALVAALLGTFAVATATAQAANRPPTLVGPITATGTNGTWYSFKPYARDPDGDTLTFRVTNKPAWANFNTSVGRLNGTARTGTYANVTISVSDGQYTRTLGPVTIVVASTTPPPPPPPPPPPTTGTLSERYPGDVGIAADPAVIFHDPYEDTSPSTLSSRYQDVQNSAGVSMVSDKPTKSRGARSVRLTAGGSAEATHLFRNFSTGYDEVYLRYYAKYAGAANSWGHSGFWFGGYNPASNWPNPRAGQKPTGSDRFSFGLEPVSGGLMDLYTYWTKMHSFKANPGAGDYYGNLLVVKNNFRLRANEWNCYEVHLKLNPDPSTGRDAVLEVWENDQLVRRHDNTGPFGWWNHDVFCPADSDAPICANYAPSNPSQVQLDQQWRSSSALKFNHIWAQNYNNSGNPSSLLFDDLVVAKSRVGCLR